MSRGSGRLVAIHSELAWSDQDGVHALFHRPSGATHFVNPATRLLLVRVFSEPRDLEAATGELARLQGAENDDEFRAHVAGLVERLEELGLVRRC